MENLSFGEKKGMILNAETLAQAIREWIKNDDSGSVVASVDKIATRSGVSARTINGIKDYQGHGEKPNPTLSVMLKISQAIDSKLEINKKFDSE